MWLKATERVLFNVWFLVSYLTIEHAFAKHWLTKFFSIFLLILHVERAMGIIQEKPFKTYGVAMLANCQDLVALNLGFNLSATAIWALVHFCLTSSLDFTRKR